MLQTVNLLTTLPGRVLILLSRKDLLSSEPDNTLMEPARDDTRARAPVADDMISTSGIAVMAILTANRTVD